MAARAVAGACWRNCLRLCLDEAVAGVVAGGSAGGRAPPRPAAKGMVLERCGMMERSKML